MYINNKTTVKYSTEFLDNIYFHFCFSFVQFYFTKKLQRILAFYIMPIIIHSSNHTIFTYLPRVIFFVLNILNPFERHVLYIIQR